MNTVERFLVGNWERLGLGPLGSPRQLTSIVMTPRFRASRHAVLFVFVAGSARPLLVVKVPRLPGENGSLDYEVANLRAVHSVRPGGFDSIPRIIAYEDYLGSRLLVESAMAGHPMKPTVVRREPKTCIQAVLEWLTTLHVATADWGHVPKDSFGRLVEKRLRYFERTFPLSREERHLLDATRRVVSPLEHVQIPVVFEHGDLSSPNILRLRSGGVGVVDWELADPRGLPAVDLFFFLSYVAFAQSKAETLRGYVEAFRSAFFGPDAWAHSYIGPYAERLGLPSAALRALFVACWCRYVIAFLPRLNDLGAGPRLRPDRETAAWLRANRYFSLWQYAVEHIREARLGG